MMNKTIKNRKEYQRVMGYIEARISHGTQGTTNSLCLVPKDTSDHIGATEVSSNVIIQPLRLAKGLAIVRKIVHSFPKITRTRVQE